MNRLSKSKRRRKRKLRKRKREKRRRLMSFPTFQEVRMPLIFPRSTKVATT
jgi:hypothetical protein